MSELALELAVVEAHEAAEDAWYRAERRRRMRDYAITAGLIVVLAVWAYVLDWAVR